MFWCYMYLNEGPRETSETLHFLIYFIFCFCFYFCWHVLKHWKSSDITHFPFVMDTDEVLWRQTRALNREMYDWVFFSYLKTTVFVNSSVSSLADVWSSCVRFILLDPWYYELHNSFLRRPVTSSRQNWTSHPPGSSRVESCNRKKSNIGPCPVSWFSCKRNLQQQKD